MNPSSSRIAWMRELVGLEIALWDLIDARLRRDAGITMVVFEVLCFVERSSEGRVRVGELARMLHFTVGGASKLADRIEGMGLIRREADAGDRRVSWLGITDAGVQKLAQARDEYERELAGCVDGILDDEKREQMRVMMKEVRDAIGKTLD